MINKYLFFVIGLLLLQGAEVFHLSFDVLEKNNDNHLHEYKDGSIRFTIGKEASFLHNPVKHDCIVLSEDNNFTKEISSYEDFRRKCAEITASDYSDSLVVIRSHRDYFYKIFLYKREKDRILKYEVEWLEVLLD